MCPMLFQPRPSQQPQLPPFPPVNRLFRSAVGPINPGFDFNKNDLIAIFGNKVYLSFFPASWAPTATDDSITALSKKNFGRGFSPTTESAS